MSRSHQLSLSAALLLLLVEEGYQDVFRPGTLAQHLVTPVGIEIFPDMSRRGPAFFDILLLRHYQTRFRPSFAIVLKGIPPCSFRFLPSIYFQEYPLPGVT